MENLDVITFTETDNDTQAVRVGFRLGQNTYVMPVESARDLAASINEVADVAESKQQQINREKH